MGAASMWDLVESGDDISLLDEFGNALYDVTEDGQTISGDTDTQDQVEQEYKTLGLLLKAYNSGYLSSTQRTPLARLQRVVRDDGGPNLSNREFEHLLLSYNIVPVGESKLVVPDEFAAIYRNTMDRSGNSVWRPPAPKELASVV